MTDHELLLSISDLMDQKIMPIEKRMDRFEEKLIHVEQNLTTKFDYLDAKIDNVEQNLTAEIKRLDTKIDSVEQSLKGDIHLINLKFENIIEPRLNEIESCYVTTSERYQIAIEKFESHETDLSVMKSIIREHAKKLKQRSA